MTYWIFKEVSNFIIIEHKGPLKDGSTVKVVIANGVMPETIGNMGLADSWRQIQYPLIKKYKALLRNK